MGKAIIQSHLGAGKYRIRLQFDNAAIQTKISAITTKLDEIAAELVTLAAAKSAKHIELDAANLALNNYIAVTPTEEIIANPAEINRLTTEAYKILGEYHVIDSDYSGAVLRKTALEKEKSYLQNYCPDDIELDAWCVAKNEVLIGETATIEIDYALKRNQDGSIANNTGVWILADSQQSTPTAPTTILQHPLAGSQHSVWYNLGALPAVQRDIPLYRIGTISNLDKIGSTCTVTYDGLGAINEASSNLLPSSPIYPGLVETAAATIEYAPCNGSAFEDGDRVIVKTGHIVIGFYSNPRACDISGPVTGPFITNDYFDKTHDVYYSAYGITTAHGTTAAGGMFMEGLIKVTDTFGDPHYYVYYLYQQQPYKVLKNNDTGLPYGLDDVWNFTFGAASADIPALLQLTGPATAESLPPISPPSGLDVFMIRMESGFAYNYKTGSLIGPYEILQLPVGVYSFDMLRAGLAIDDYAFTMDMGPSGTLPYGVYSINSTQVEFRDTIHYP